MAWQSNYALITAPPAPCRPWWAPRFDAASNAVVTNGSQAIGGKVPVSAEALRQQAQAAMGFTVTNNTYALARYLASERGNAGTVEEKMALALLALNQAKAAKTDAFGLLARRNVFGYPVYGPIHSASSIEAETYHGDYGRWAATTKDPTRRDILIARFAQTGAANSYIRGGNDQYSGHLLYDAILSDASTGGILAKAKQGQYWVGPLANVNPLAIYIYAPVPDVPWNSSRGQALITRAKAWLTSPPVKQWMTEKRAEQHPAWLPDGKKTAVCARQYFDEPRVQVALGATGVVLLGLGAWTAARRGMDFRHLFRRLV